MTAQTTLAQLIASATSAGTWALDPARSTVAIRGKSIWGLVTVDGTFKEVDGEGHVEPDGKARGVLAIDAASIDTNHKKRDAHLRSKDFFNVDTHETIAFTANQVVARKADDVEVTGELAVNGIAKPLGFTAKVIEAHAEAVVLRAELVLQRKDFGMTWNMLGMLKPNTTVTVTACFVPA